MMKRVIVLFISIFLMINSFVLITKKSLAATELSTYAFVYPTIDGSFSQNGWSDSLRIELPFGFLHVKNNMENFYFLLDITKDTAEDKTTSLPRCEDGFEFVIDWDGNKKITSNIDRVYTLCRSVANRLVYRYYQGSNSFSDQYNSSGACFASFGITPNSSVSHRIFEGIIPLPEVRLSSKQNVRIGIRVFSLHPSFELENPSNCLTDFSDLYEITLAKQPDTIEITCRLGSTKLQINNQSFWMDVAPMIHHKRSFMPMRFIIEPFGGSLEWNDKKQQVVIRIFDMIIDMTVEKPDAYVNNKVIRIDPGNKNVTPILLPPGRVLLPIRFFSETIGCKVLWDSKTEIITIILEKE